MPLTYVHPPSNCIRVKPFSLQNFKRALDLEASVVEDDASDDSWSCTHDQVKYIARYLREGSAIDTGEPCTCMVIEDVYYSVDYRAEYEAYYAHCFQPFNHYAKRIHFFKKLGLDELKDFLDRSLLSPLREDGLVAQLNESYLGFVVVRPVPSVPIGFTALRHYPPGESGRLFIDRELLVHLAGIPLTVKAAPFMQQDQSVAACATTAIWAAMQVLPHNLTGPSPSTVAITDRATSHRTKGRPYPAYSGLDIWQVSEALRQSGWAPDTLDQFPERYYRALLRSYVISGFPIIIAMKHVEPVMDDGHAVTVIGCNEAAEDAWYSEDLLHVSIRIPVAGKVYLHDDRQGPYCRASVYTPTDRDSQDDLEDDPKQVPVFLALDWIKTGTDDEAQKVQEKFKIDYSLIPHYPPVRLSMPNLYALSIGLVDSFHPYTGYDAEIPVDLEIFFEESQTFLAERAQAMKMCVAKRDMCPSRSTILSFLKNIALPRYVGVTEVARAGELLYTLIWDTTDFLRQGQRNVAQLLGIITWQEPIRDGWNNSIRENPKLLPIPFI